MNCFHSRTLCTGWTVFVTGGRHSMGKRLLPLLSLFAILLTTAGCSAEAVRSQAGRIVAQARLANDAAAIPDSPGNRVLVAGADGNLFLVAPDGGGQALPSPRTRRAVGAICSRRGRPTASVSPGHDSTANAVFWRPAASTAASAPNWPCPFSPSIFTGARPAIGWLI